MKPKLRLQSVGDTFVIWQHGQEALQKFLTYLKIYNSLLKLKPITNYFLYTFIAKTIDHLEHFV